MIDPTGFVVSDLALARRFHDVGGRDNGKRERRAGADECYGAVVLYPDGNNIEACARGQSSR